jgi:hypothetical protein
LTAVLSRQYKCEKHDVRSAPEGALLEIVTSAKNSRLEDYAFSLLTSDRLAGGRGSSAYL